FVLQPFLVRRAFQRGPEAYRQPQKVVISQEGFSTSLPNTITTVKWDAVCRVVVTEKLLLLAMSPTETQVIPRRAFADEKTWLSFVEAVKNYYPGEFQIVNR